MNDIIEQQLHKLYKWRWNFILFIINCVLVISFYLYFTINKGTLLIPLGYSNSKQNILIANYKQGEDIGHSHVSINGQNVIIYQRNENVTLPRCPTVTGKRILISFASDCCRRSQLLNCKTGLEVGGFDVCVLFGPESIDANFKRRVIDPLLQISQRGFGFWVWKPYIILK